MSIRINLLPHREMRRERRKKDYVGLLAFVGIGAAAAAVVVALGIDQRIDAQRARNDFIRAENAKLDEQIKEIATLRAEIDALRARQYAVESLQANRTIPVHLMDELVKHTPEGIYLKTMRQDERKITLTGYAQSNDRVSELLRNLANRTPWLERPELVEIKASRVGGPSAPKDARRVFEFSLNALIKTTEPQQRGPAPKTTSAPATLAAAGASANR
ncbi:MAG: PilN domain-containing protein [Burkholderiaceae bacterium]|jgi:type IV pilus assembly protein PilN|nr:PilN domain-containing protein [Burkholderiaceae bacterium]HMN63531.1 PilN domain-containing protein [Burkholderiaceae bacterium]